MSVGSGFRLRLVSSKPKPKQSRRKLYQTDKSSPTGKEYEPYSYGGFWASFSFLFVISPLTFRKCAYRSVTVNRGFPTNPTPRISKGGVWKIQHPSSEIFCTRPPTFPCFKKPRKGVCVIVRAHIKIGPVDQRDPVAANRNRFLGTSA